ncbi:MAG: HyaD/HybD family hydrogenase maturation endopeptidase [Gemmatimonadales bacterium]|nr:HyaD/HybD family hydrogenase maturation endopeptidase [Gemmatimonadales bacterium]
MPGTLILGLGNPLMGDDGVGVAAVGKLREAWELPADVTVVDGGTWGMNLLPLIESAGRLILVDAIDTGAAPGTLTVLERHELPKLFVLKLSPHQIDLREVLALAEWRGALPAYLVAVGVQPRRVEMDLALSPEVAAALGKLVDLVVDRLESAGHRCRRREAAVGA